MNTSTQKRRPFEQFRENEKNGMNQEIFNTTKKLKIHI